MRRKFNVQVLCLVKGKRKYFFSSLLLAFLFVTGLQVDAQETETMDTTVASIDTSYYDETEIEVEPEEESSIYFTPRWLQDTALNKVKARKIPDTAMRQLTSADDFWYSGLTLKKEKERQASTRESLSEQSWFNSLLWFVIIIGFIIVVIMYLSNSNISLFRQRNRTIESDGEDQLDTDDIFAINYQREIDKAAVAGNYRLAIRLMFLRLLKNLSQKNIIQYKHDRTNFDYLLQLSSTKYYNDFFTITRHYEYSWYGKFEISSDTYSFIKNEFDNFDPAIK